MKDAYSLDSTWEGLDVAYQKHYDAYCKIFEKCGIKFFVVGASSGAMGGKQSQEFMVESDSGEDICAVTDGSFSTVIANEVKQSIGNNKEIATPTARNDGSTAYNYSANIEVATSKVAPVKRLDDNPTVEEFATPNAKTIDELVEQFNIPEERCAKSVVYIVDDMPWLILMRGNDELNETKLQTVAGTGNLRPALPEELVKFFGASHGSIGPVNLNETVAVRHCERSEAISENENGLLRKNPRNDGSTKIKIIADNLLKDANCMVSGANKDGYHLKNIDLHRDAKIEAFYDLRTVQAGEICELDNQPLRIVKAIELGHIFKLGTKYSEALEAYFLDAEGKEHPIIMGSYGIGVERIMACYIEQNHDEKGIIWNKALAPFDIHLLGLNLHKSEEVKTACENIYDELTKIGFDILFDDREETAGVKFNDADLIGLPIQIVVGQKNLKEGNIEIKIRRTGEKKIIKIEHTVDFLRGNF